MEFKGSKGKWYIENLNEPKEGKYPAFEIDVSTEIEQNMCTIWYSELFSVEAKANALLISKAPEMLNELENIVDCWDKNVFQELDIDAIRKLIKEATEI